MAPRKKASARGVNASKPTSTRPATTGATKKSASRKKTAASTKGASTKAIVDRAKRAAKKTPAKQTKAQRTSSSQTPKNPKPTTIDEYLSHVDTATKVLLQRLRATIHELVPEVSECISYSMPAFRYRGKVIAGFLATKAGASYFPFSGNTLGTLSVELEGYSQTKSGLHFTADAPLPKQLVNTLLQTRIAEL